MAIHPAWLSIIALYTTLGIAAPLLSDDTVKQGLQRIQTGNIPSVEAVNIDGAPYLMVVVSTPKKPAGLSALDQQRLELKAKGLLARHIAKSRTIANIQISGMKFQILQTALERYTVAYFVAISNIQTIPANAHNQQTATKKNQIYNTKRNNLESEFQMAISSLTSKKLANLSLDELYDLRDMYFITGDFDNYNHISDLILHKKFEQ